MTGYSVVSADWLELRATADARSRSTVLAAYAARGMKPGPVVVHDLGSGSGAMMRWLAPLLPGPQEWVLHDADPGILAERDTEPVLDASDRAITSRTSVEQLADLRRDAFAGASLVVASALLDVLTEVEARAIVGACVEAGVPAFFSLSVVGRVSLDPDRAADAEFQASFNEHQRRDADGRRLLGPDAVAAMAGMFESAGWNTRTEPTPWVLGSSDGPLIAEWLDGWLWAAVEQRPELAEAAEAYRHGDLRVVVQHEDLFAWPA
ncbi:MAG: SAM-dependent methyltransferase [Frankiales bacterium]|nr:SAM-dependent methyltransferase [Frankiales bacterium]